MTYDIRRHRIYCPNCSTVIYGYGNEEGLVKFSCPRCHYSRASKKAGRSKLRSDEFFPHGGVFYGEETDFIPDEDDLII